MPDVEFMETPDATQAFHFWPITTGDVSYETKQLKSGLASWKCDTGAGPADAYLRNDSLFSAASGRLSFYFERTFFGDSFLLAGIGANDLAISLNITVANRLALGDNSTGFGGLYTETIGSKDLLADTTYRISMAWTITSSTDFNVAVYIDGVLEIDFSDADNTLAGTGTHLRIGAVDGVAGTNDAVNIAHVFTDLGGYSDGDIGDVRVTAKLPTGAGGTNGWDCEQVSGSSVSDRPIDNTTGHLHAGSDDQVESSDIEAAGVGDEDITGETVLGHTGWVWANRGSGGAGSPSFLVNDAETSITLTST